MLLEFFLLLTLLWLVLYLYFTRNFSYWTSRKVPQVDPLPFFGNAFDIVVLKKSIGDLCHDIYRRSREPFIGIFVADEPYLLVRDLDLIKTILIKDFNVFFDRTISENKAVDSMGSHILFILKNPDWKEMRRKITPVFTSGKMKLMYRLIKDSGEEMLEYLGSKVEDEAVVETREVCAKYTTDAITSTSFGINANCFKDEDAEFRQVSRRVFNWSILERAISMTCYFVAPNLVRLFGLRFIDAASSKFLREAFWRTMREREEKKYVRNDLIDILIAIKNKEEIDDSYKLEGDKLVAQATQFFMAGYETSSSTISFTLYELARNPEVQKKLRDEVLSVKIEHGEFTYDALKKMEYLDMCIKETLRKYPVLPFLDRRCNSDYTIPGTKVVLKKGTPIFISTLGLHYDPQYFPEPDVYDPERFSPENVNSMPLFSYLPFGEGPRNCIGARFGTLSSKSGVAHIISRFKIETCSQTQDPMVFDPKGFLLAPIGGLRLKFKKIIFN